MHNNRYRIAVFDNDGTLLDSFKTLYDIDHQLLAERNLTSNEELCRRSWGVKGWHQFYNELGVKDIDALIEEFYRREQKITEFKVIPGAEFTLSTLSAIGIPIYLVSWTQPESLRIKMRVTGLDRFFDDSNSYAVETSKTDTLKQIRCAHAVEPGQVIFVTDTYKDIIEGKAANVKTVGIANQFSYNIESIIRGASPDILISDIREVPKIFLGRN